MVQGKGFLRPISEDELVHWLALSQTDYIDDLMKNFLYSKDVAEHEAVDSLRTNLPQGINTPDQHFRIYEQDKQTLAYLWYSLKNNSAFLMDLMLLPAYQGKGIGKDIMQALIAELRACGAEEIELRVAAHNQRARRLYEHFGFRVTGLDMHLPLCSHRDKP